MRFSVENFLTALRELSGLSRFRRFDEVGRDVCAFGALSVSNKGRMEIGDAVRVSSIPVPSHFAASSGGTIRIGDGVRIAHGVGIYTSNEVVIGAHSTIGALVMILDVELHGETPRQRGTSPRIHIGKGVHLGSGSVVLRGASIADGVYVRPNTVVSGRLA